MSGKIFRAHHVQGLVFALVGTFLFSLKSILVKQIYVYNVDPLVLLCLRMAFSLPLFILVGVYFKGKQVPGDKNTLNVSFIGKAMVCGILAYYVASFLDFTGLQYVSATQERLVLFTYPTWVVILGWLFLKEQIKFIHVAALVLTYVGIVSIFAQELGDFSGEKETLIGGAFVMTAALVFSVYMLWAKRLIQLAGSILFTCIAMTGASVAVFIHFVFVHDVSELMLSVKPLLLIAVMALVSTVLPSFFVSAAIARIGAREASIVGTLGPVFTVILAVSLLGEAFNMNHFIGLILILAGVGIVSIRRKV